MPCQFVKQTLNFSAPLITAVGEVLSRSVWVVAVTDETGRTGLGEAAPLPGFGGEEPARCVEALAKVMPKLTLEYIWNWLARERSDAALGVIEPMLAKTPCARAAVEGALLDLLAQRQNKTLSELLSEAVQLDSLPVNALVGSDTPQAMADHAQELALEGFTNFKLKMGGVPDDDLKRVFAVREAIGPNSNLRVDANGVWTLEQATAFLIKAREANLEFCEQPLPADDLAGMAALRKQTGVAIAVDESVRQPADVGRIAAAQAADIVILKPMFLGGWRPTKQAAGLAKSQGLEVVITTSLEGSIGRAHAAHIATAIGKQKRAQGLSTGDLLERDLTTSPLKISAGRIRFTAIPGLGVGNLH